jgi:hypothetical protein
MSILEPRLIASALPARQKKDRTAQAKKWRKILFSPVMCIICLPYSIHLPDYCFNEIVEVNTGETTPELSLS